METKEISQENFKVFTFPLTWSGRRKETNFGNSAMLLIKLRGKKGLGELPEHLKVWKRVWKLEHVLLRVHGGEKGQKKLGVLAKSRVG